MALNEQDFGGASFVGNSPACGNTITVNFGGKSVVVTVVSVGMMGLNNFDLSVAAFEQLSVSGLMAHDARTDITAPRPWAH
jgi:hypothetical protein